ncbi:MAG: hypothetical protein E7211_19580, partial [Clostridium lundense]|nr:hypothetical protein [Clostridium lundense]
VYWKSSDASVASVDDNGKVTAHDFGTVTITATTADGGRTATCVVTVKKTPITELSFPDGALELYINGDGVGQPSAASAALTVVPDNTTETITYRSENVTVASVDDNGDVTAVGGGTAQIIATASGGRTAQRTVNVTVLPTGVELPATMEMSASDHTALTATVRPVNVTQPKLKWTLTGSEYVHVSDGGVVSADAAHISADVTVTVTVSVTAAETTAPSKSATCTVTVHPVAVTAVSLSPARMTLRVGDAPVTLDATVLPDNAAAPELAWTSSSPSVATVDQAGVVTPVAAGEATITAKTSNDVSGVCYVTVENVPVERITLTPSALSFRFNDKAHGEQTISAAATPANATDKTVSWSSSNTSVATVDANGKVTMVAPGTASIIARSNGTPSVTAECDVTVTATPVETITLNKTALELNLNPADSVQLIAAVLPANADDPSLSWSSSAGSIVSVDQTGKVTAVSRGTAVITAAAKDGSGVSAVCVVNVWQKVDSVSLNKTALSLGVGKSETLTATLASATDAPPDITDVVWSSSDPNIASVDQAGRVTAHSAGSAAITVTTADQSKTAECAVTVTNVAVTDVTVSPAALTFKAGEQRVLTAAVEPAEATDKTLTWSSSADGVVTVQKLDGSGATITAVAAGTATVTATSVNGVVGRCEITVRAAVSNVTLNTPSLTLQTGASETLTVTVAPSGADQSVTWKSLDESIATVDSTGKVTATTKTGSTIITVTAVDGGKSASCAVTVLKNAASIGLSRNSIDLSLSQNAELTATLAPAGATDDILWSVDGSAVQLGTPTVSNGTSKVSVYAHSGGTATVTAYSAVNHDIKATCTVKVTVPAASLTLDRTALTLTKGDGAVTLTATVLPAGASNADVSWSVAPASGVVTYETSGSTITLRPDAAGTATVTATVGDLTAQCSVTVKPKLVETITIKQGDDAVTELSLTTGSAAVQLTEDVGPEAADNRTVTWSSSDSNVATVVDGLVTAKGIGTAVVTAAANDGSGVSASCIVTVGEITVTSVTLDPTSLSFNLTSDTKTATLTAAVDPANATAGTVAWMSSNPNVATVSAATGGSITVTAVGAGSAIITASAGGKTATCTVTVTAPVSGVTLDADSLDLVKGASAVLTATVAPESAANKNVTWSSDDDTVATVTSSGRVTAVGAGETTITVKTADGGKTAACTVKVTVPAASLTLDRTALTLTKGDGAVTLTAAVLPAGASNADVSWSVAPASGVVTYETSGSTIT